MVTEDKQLVPKCTEIFLSFYERFINKEGVFGPKQLGKFIESCTDGTCKEDDNRVLKLFKLYDPDGTKHFTPETFL